MNSLYVVMENQVPFFDEGIWKIFDVNFNENDEVELIDQAIASSVLHLCDSDTISNFSEMISSSGSSNDDIEAKCAEMLNKCLVIHRAWQVSSPEERNVAYRTSKRALQNKRLERLKNRDRNLFFNQPEAQADFSDWQSHVLFTVDEIVALSFGKDPNVVNLKRFKNFYDPSNTPFGAEFVLRHQQISRAIEAGDLQSPLKAAAFNKWCRANNVAVCEDFYELFERSMPDQLATGRQLSSLYSMILSMACGKYQIDYNKITDKHPPDTRDLEHDLELNGCVLKPRSIMDNLKAAHEWAEKNGKGPNRPSKIAPKRL